MEFIIASGMMQSKKIVETIDRKQVPVYIHRLVFERETKIFRRGSIGRAGDC